MEEAEAKTSYMTVCREAEAEYTVEKSRFIAYVKPVHSREEAENFISEIRERDRDATHNVPCFVLGRKQDVMW